MGLFRKKADPLAQRSQSLNRRIAELEAEIARLNQNLTKPADPAPAPTPSAPIPGPDSRGRPPAIPASHEPVFEKMPARPLETRTPPQAGRESVELGLKRPLWSAWWRRLKRQFVDPPPANEKLVNYLAAGSIQGLRSLRYERRIARNRIIFVCVLLGILLWAGLVMFWQTR